MAKEKAANLSGRNYRTDMNRDENSSQQQSGR